MTTQNSTTLSENLRLRARVHGASDVGRRRSSNEDQFLVARLRKSMLIDQCSFATNVDQVAEVEGHLWLVADGMGGHQGGETASQLTTAAIQDFALNSLKWFLQGRESSELLEDFANALRQTDLLLVEESRQHPELFGMGTTLTLAFFLGLHVYVFHVGDSRCYVVKGGRLHQVTHDHTLREALAAEGRLPTEPAVQERLSHVLTNVMGGAKSGIQVDMHKVRVESGDQLLLCSDGLTAMVPDADVAQVLLAQAESPASACRALMELANERGGDDNITVIVASFTDADLLA